MTVPSNPPPDTDEESKMFATLDKYFDRRDAKYQKEHEDAIAAAKADADSRKPKGLLEMLFGKVEKDES